MSDNTSTPPHQHYAGGPVLGGRVCTSSECHEALRLGLVCDPETGELMGPPKNTSTRADLCDPPATYDRRHGYFVGPTVERPPWPLMWEQAPEADGCPHVWECVLLQPDFAGYIDEVVRCVWCHTPRCGESRCDPPCMKRRHHRDDHHYLDGTNRPLGGAV